MSSGHFYLPPHMDTNMLELFISLAFGLFSWTFAEYATHHWVNHLGKGKNALSRSHLEHHRTSELVDTRLKYLSAAFLGLFFGSLAVFLVGTHLGIAWTVGFVGGYLVYELTHERLHTHKPPHAYGALLRRHHFSHHFTSPKYNHGVTTRFWDWVSRTHAPLKKIRVPRRLAMSWLLDDEGRVRSEYAAHYEIR